MTRRTPTPRVGESGRRANRMVPGGRLYSETSISSYNPAPGFTGDTAGLLVLEAVAEAVAPDIVAPGPFATLTPPPPPP